MAPSEQDQSSQMNELLTLMLLLAYTCILLWFRMSFTQTLHFSFLYWNIFLAFIPLLVALFYELTRGRFKGWIWLSLCLFVWLLFLPNAPYLTTDLLHLNRFGDRMPRWFDPLMLASAALTGLWAGFYSLRLFEAEIRLRLGRWHAQVFVASVWFLNGIGVYLGRVLRWNSWDLFRRPGKLFQDTAAPFLNPEGFTQAIGLIVLYGTFFWLSYLFWRSRQSEPVMVPLEASPSKG